MKFLEKYGVFLDNDNLLEVALTHTSYSNENKDSVSYERLEFLGDAVLQLVTSDYFYNSTSLKEGDMTKKRASYVCELALNHYSKKINFKEYIRVGHGQQSNVNEAMIADVFEAIVGVIFLEKGFEEAKEFIHKIVVPEIEKGSKFFSDYKTLLQELTQTSRKTVEYVLVNEEGLAHEKTFTIDVVIDNIVYGRGVGKSKKDAEQKAAKDAYDKSVK